MMYMPRRFTGRSLTGKTTFPVPSGRPVESSLWPRVKHMQMVRGAQAYPAGLLAAGQPEGCPSEQVGGVVVARSSLIQKYLGDKIKGVNKESDLGPGGAVGVRDDFLGPGCVGAGPAVGGSWVSAADPGPRG